MTGTPSASTMVAAAAMSAPTSRLPVVSTVTWTRIGVSRPASSRARLAPLTAALICSGSWHVSMMIRVDRAGDQPGALDGERVFELLVGDMAERRQAGPGPDRAQHKAGAAVMRELGDRVAANLGRETVQRKGAVGKAELAQGDRRAAKAVGLDRVAAGGEIAAVDLADQVGTALADDLGAVFETEKIALGVEVARLDLRPHRPVAQARRDRRGNRENGSSAVGRDGCRDHLYAAAAAGRGARTPSRWQIATIRSARFSV